MIDDKDSLKNLNYQNSRTGREIAVIGMSGRFPGAANINEYWENLQLGVESISFFSDTELQNSGITKEWLKQENYIKAYGILEGIENFDSNFFGYSPREAKIMDPQMRLFHEVIWHALEDAGYNPQFEGLAIGLFAGASDNFNWRSHCYHSGELEEIELFSLDHLLNKDFLCVGISYRLDLKGPAVVVQSTCSTSLLAIHMACQSIFNGECDIALAGGVNVKLVQKGGYLYREGMILSPDGHCRAFSSEAEGTISGDGAGVVVLKNIEEAESDEDNIYAIIKGSGINNDGYRKIGFTAPSIEGQADAIVAALEMSEIDPGSVSYIETHGTGTPLGDPIEIEALTLGYECDKKQFCAIGSVKTNVGHLDCAAGVAGFIKAVLCLKHRRIPSSLHSDNLNSKIDFSNSPFYVNKTLREWRSQDYPFRAGVSSFGIGGTNVHIILEEWENPNKGDYDDLHNKGIFLEQINQLLVLSAKTDKALVRMIQNLSGFFNTHPSVSMPNVAFTLKYGRKFFKNRASIVVDSCKENIEKLKFPENWNMNTVISSVNNSDIPVIFMFPGQGSQYLNMGYDLYHNEQGFRNELDACFTYLNNYFPIDLKEILYPTELSPDRLEQFKRALNIDQKNSYIKDKGENCEDDIPSLLDHMINQTQIAQPLLFIIEYALAKFLITCGLKPRGMIGHSLGEFTAACLSGAISFSDTLALVVLRGRRMQQETGGSMLSVPLREDQLLPLLKGRNLSISVINAPSQSVISGPTEEIVRLMSDLDCRGIKSRILKTSHAFHSGMMDKVMTDFEKSMIDKKIKFNKAKIPFISNVTGQWITDDQISSPGYWASHLRETVRFSQGLEKLIKGGQILLEVGPGRALSMLAQQHIIEECSTKQKPIVLNMMRHPRKKVSDHFHFLDKIGLLWGYGKKIDFTSLSHMGSRKRISLPLYPFEKDACGNFSPLKKELSQYQGKRITPIYSQKKEENKKDSDILLKEDPAGRFQPANSLEKKLTDMWCEFFGLEMIKPKDDFFELGGDSLKAMIIINKIYEQLGVKLSLDGFFNHSTILELIEFIQLSRQEKFISIPAVEKKEYYSISSAQKRLYILQQLYEESTAYNMSFYFSISIDIKIEQLREIFYTLLNRHESLRTSFHMVEEEPVQRIHDEVKFEINEVELEGYGVNERIGTNSLISGLLKDFTHSFELSKVPLLRVGFVKIGKTKIILLDMHHIITDGTSQLILQREFLDIFQQKKLTPIKLYYKDFSVWQHQPEQFNYIRSQEKFWWELFSGEVPVLNLPTDYPRPLVQSFEGNTACFILNEEETGLLKELASKANATLYMSLLAVYSILLFKLSGQEDIIIGTPIASRRHADLEPIVGMFVNTLAMRNFPYPNMNFIHYLNNVKENTLAAYENQEYQFEDLVENVSLQRDTSRNPIFDVMLNLLNQEDYNGLESDVSKQGDYIHRQGTSKFDLNLTVVDRGNGLWCSMEYSTLLYKPSTIERFIGYLHQILYILSHNFLIKLSEINILPNCEKEQILQFCYGDQEIFDTSQSIHSLFNKQAQQNSDAIAVVFNDQNLSYQGLNVSSNTVAHYLREKGVIRDSLVGIMVERSLELIIGILGILKAGGGYLPIDSEYPNDRIKYMLSDSCATTLITTSKLNDEIRIQEKLQSPNNIMTIFMDEIDFTLLPSHSIAYTPSHFLTFSLSHLAYVIYTSGTTGRPKGVMVEHKNVVNLIRYQYHATKIDFSRILQFATISFDASFHEIFSALLFGGTIYLINKEKRVNIIELFFYISINEIQTVFLPMSFLKLIFSDMEYIGYIPSCLRHIQTAGEQVVVSEKFRRYLKEKHIYLHNHYGPSETHVVTTFTIVPEEEIPELPSIGKPIFNTWIHILDKGGHLTPIKVPGELYIGGIQVGRGYLNNPELTAERFCLRQPETFLRNKTSLEGKHKAYPYNMRKINCRGEPRVRPHSENISRLYYTGDLGCWQEDGNIEFLGRIDHQVKVRGFRVELGEIESRLMEYPGIKKCVVIARKEESGDQYLGAYLVSDYEVESFELRKYLLKSVPDYMVPSYFLYIDEMPVTISGKINRNALPKPEYNLESYYIAPRNAVERQLEKIWKDVLFRESSHTSQRIGIDCNFFELGGQSLKATFVINKIHKEFDIKISLAEFFISTSIRGLSEYIQKAKPDLFETIEPVEKREYYSLSSAQKRLFILQQMDIESIAYNMPFYFSITGEMTKDQLELTFRKLINRHEGFRTSFHMWGEEPVQCIHEEVELGIDVELMGDRKITDENNSDKGLKENRQNISDHIKGFSRPFDLTNAPLLRVEILKMGTGQFLFIDMHHIITDGTSQMIIEKEFMSFFHGEMLTPLKLHYKDFSQWQNRKEQRNFIQNQGSFWQELFPGEIPILNLPADYSRPLLQRFAGKTVHFDLNEEETQKLTKIATQANVTLFMFLLGVYDILLSKLSGQVDIIVGTGTAGRRHAELEGIMGLFVNTLPLRNVLQLEQRFQEFLAEIKNKILRAFENQEYPFEEMVEMLKIKRDTSRNPIFDVMFQFNNFEIPEIKRSSQTLEPNRYERGTTKFDLTLWGWESPGHLSFAFEYSTNLFKQETIDIFVRFFLDIIRTIVKNPDQKLSEIQQMDPMTKKKILATMNLDLAAEQKRMGERGEILQHRLNESLRTFADKIALDFEDQRLSYDELDKRSNQIAHIIVQQGIAREAFIGVLMTDNFIRVSALLGILKAGCAFVLLDSNGKQDLLGKMMASADITFLLVDSPSFPGYYIHGSNKQKVACIYIAEDIEKEKGFSMEHPPQRDYRPGDMLYIYFTSGSTGSSKAILGRNNSLLHFIDWEMDTFGVDENFRFSQLINPGFDAFLRDLLVPLCSGGVICIPGSKEITLNSERLARWMELKDITLIHCVPSLFRVFSTSSLSNNRFKGLKYILLSGERIEPIDLVDWYQIIGERIKIVNLYGPSETTLIKTYHFIQEDDLKKPGIPVGVPMRGSAVMILDNDMNLCDKLVVGEIYIHTPYATYGYYNNPELNRACFLQNPFNPVSWDTIYKTGDRGRFLSDGSIELLGRTDRQIKIRGIRIELEGIECTILRYPGVREAAVIKKKRANQIEILYSYITVKEAVNNQVELLLAKLKEYLARQLPEYMIPATIEVINEIPRTANGKVDYDVLHQVKSRILDYTPPQNEVERKLVKIWAEMLNLEKVGINDNFFNLGGNSLSAMTLISRIHKEFYVRIPLGDVFNNPTIRGFAAYIQQAKHIGHSFIQSVEKREYYPLSSAQKRLYILQQMDRDSIAYNMPYFFYISKESQKDRLEVTFKKLINRHESLRTSFQLLGDEPIQRINSNFEFKIKEIEDAHIHKGISGYLRNFTHPFNLSQSPLLRVALFEIDSTQRLLIIDMHHIITDGTSQMILEKEFMDLFHDVALIPLKLQYKDFSQWQNRPEQRKFLHDQEAFWLNLYSVEPLVLNLPTDYPRPLQRSFEGSAVRFILSKNEMELINKIVTQTNVTLYVSLLSIFTILLSKLSNQEEIIIGTPIAARRHIDLEQIIGMFVNTLSLRNYPYRDRTFRNFLEDVKEKSIMAFENQEYPFEDLVEKLSIKRDIGRNPLFDVMFVLENMNPGLGNQGKEEKIESNPSIQLNPLQEIDQIFQIAKFDLTLSAVENEGELFLSFEYCTKLYKKETIDRFIGYFKQIFSVIVSNPGICIGDIEIISKEEKKQILYDFNNTDVIFTKDKSIHGLFEEQVESKPDYIALHGYMVAGMSGEEGTITYKELNEKSNRLASHLQLKGVGIDIIVGIIMERSVEMIIGMLGILKAGGAYLPIDPGYPLERINYMLSDSRAMILITTTHPKENIRIIKESKQKSNLKIIYIEEIRSFSLPSHSLTSSLSHFSTLAYIIYTSGSSGRPKGILVEHQSLINAATWQCNYFCITERDNISQYAPVVFDASVLEIFPCLIQGAALHIVDNRAKMDPQELNLYYETKNITISFLPTQFCELFMELENTSLRALLVAGDKLQKFVPQDYQLYNNYGPTESTVVTTVFPVKNQFKNIPIGKPIHNIQLYILNPVDLNLQPIGISGELCITGESLVRGYLNQPELTNEKFVNNPWILGKKMYKTGDLSRWLSDGNIEFLGRIDHQVKIRGFRVELGEIEDCLLKVDGIKEVVVVYKEFREGKNIYAYFVSHREYRIPELREYLSMVLPHYMIPSYFVQLEKIPLTTNGKINRKALPDPIFEKDHLYMAPRNEIERQLVRIWSDVLGIESSNLSIENNFFELGGDSIKGLQISARLQKYGQKLEIKDLFLNPCIAQLSKYVQKVNRSIDQGIVVGEVPLTPIQEWYFQEHGSDLHHFNQSIMIYRSEGFSEYFIKEVWSKIVEHHDGLRMVYQFRGGSSVKNQEGNHRLNVFNVIQLNRGIDIGEDTRFFDFEVFDLTGLNDDITGRIEMESSMIQSSFDLETGPIVKLGLFKTSDGDYLLIVIHHLVIDGVSWRILLEDFSILYGNLLNNTETQLQPKTDSYLSWSYQLRRYAESGWHPQPKKSGSLLKELEYWHVIEGSDIPLLPVDFKVSGIEQKRKNLHRLQLTLNKRKTNSLLGEVHRAYGTEINDILLSSLGLAIYQWCGNEGIVVHLEGHGREGIIGEFDVSRTVGWFTSLFPVGLHVNGDDDISLVIKEIKESLRKIPHKGIGYGILKYLTPAAKAINISFTRPVEIIFNYLGDFSKEGNNDLFQVTGLRQGEVNSPEFKWDAKLEINGLIVKNELVLSISYNRFEYRKERIEKLVNLYHSTLLKIIEHCISKDVRELTPSDLTYPHLTLKELEMLRCNIQPEVKDEGHPGGYKIEDVYGLSPMQSGMLYHSLKNKASHAYFEQTIFSLVGDIGRNLLAESVNHVIAQYDILRTLFFHEGVEEPLQVVLKERPCSIDFEDISEIEKDSQEDHIKSFCKKDRMRGFELSRDHLLRFFLFKTGLNKYSLVWSFHHILMDGWCMSILYKEILFNYHCLKRGEVLQLDIVPQYREYIRWLMERDKSRSLTFWKNYLEGYEEQATVPNMLTIPQKSPQKEEMKKESVYELGEYNGLLDIDISGRIREISYKKQVTVNTFFQTLWGVLLQNYNNINDVVFGAVVSGRPAEIKGIERMVGLFINTIPVRVNFDPGMSFEQCLKQIQENALEAKSYEYLSLALIHTETSLKGELINHIMVFENYPLGSEIKGANNQKGLDTFNVESIEAYEQTNYDFNIIILPGPQIDIKFSFNGCVFPIKNIEKIAGHINHVLNQVLGNPGILIEEIELITESERNWLLYEINNTSVEFPLEEKIHHLFEKQSEATPDQIALVFNDLQLAYEELNKRANILAEILIDQGVGFDQVVGIMLERSFEMIFAILGILKAGGAYLPVDPEYPEGRIKYMLSDSSAMILITTTHLKENIRIIKNSKRNSNLKIIYIEEIQSSSLPSHSLTSSLSHLISPSHSLTFLLSQSTHLAYVIYTSGTTGKPKGVLVDHKNVVNEVRWYGRTHDIKSRFHVLLLSDYTFDVSVDQIFGTLIHGAVLYIVNKDFQKNLIALRQFIQRCFIHLLDFVPSFINELLCEQWNEKLTSLRSVISGAEKLDNVIKDRIIKRGYRLFNHYGPTEGTIDALATECSNQKVNLGKPIANVKCYIIGQNNKLLPVGIPGELLISGAGITRGYLNNSELTAEKFVHDCWYDQDYAAEFKIRGMHNADTYIKNGNICRPESCVRPNRVHALLAYQRQKVYKTGDLARWLGDGNIDFLGRIDNQIKIRGFRVESGEIESQLRQHDKVKDAVVISTELSPGAQQLVAYVVLTGQENQEDIPGPSELKEFISRGLPGYMVPSYIMTIDKIPLSANGKVDRKSLPTPSFINTQIYRHPRSTIEKNLVTIWQQVLRKERIGINDNFFEIGGHSLKATVVIYRIQKELNIKISFADFFSSPTIRGLGHLIQKGRAEEYVGIEPIEKKEYYSLSSAQKRLYILQQMDKESTAYNMPFFVSIIDEMKKDQLEVTFRKLINRHESLRTSFHMIKEEPVQRVKDEVKFEIKVRSIEGDILNLLTKYTHPFDLTKAPLLRVGILKMGVEQFLFLDMHHIITDGTSQVILEKEFLTLCLGKTLTPLRLQYKDFSEWQNNCQQRKKLECQERYWLELFSDEIPILELPYDCPRPRIQSFSGSSQRFVLNEIETSKLKALALNEKVTLFMILLAAYQMLLAKLSGQEDVIVGIPIANRRHADLEKIIGMFVNTLPIRNYPSPGKYFMEFLWEVKNRTLESFEHQEYPFEKLVEKVRILRDTSRNPLFDVMFDLKITETEQTVKDEENNNADYHSFLNNSDVNNSEESSQLGNLNIHLTSKFDLTLTAIESGKAISFDIEYNTDLFQRETILRFGRYFKNIILEAIKAPKKRLGEFDMIPNEEKEKLLNEFNHPGREYSKNISICQLIEQNLYQKGDEIAVIFKDDQLSYNELCVRSNGLAMVLKEIGVGIGIIIGIMLQRSVEIIICILSIFKTGAAYLPLDSQYPLQRKMYILNDSQASLLLTDRETDLSLSKGWGGKILPVSKELIGINRDEECNKLLKPNEKVFNNLPLNNPLNPAYVIYTSGTTGRPKGVIVSTGNYLNAAFAWKKEYRLHEIELILLQIAEFTFDVSAGDIMRVFLNGGKMVICPTEIRFDLEELYRILRKHYITMFDSTPALIVPLMEYIYENNLPIDHLKLLIAGSDVISLKAFNTLWSRFGDKMQILNCYGVTEATIDTLCFSGNSNNMMDRSNVPIGKPLVNMMVLILDGFTKLVPIGVAGELFIGGESVAKGYLNNPELTREKFLDIKMKDYIRDGSPHFLQWGILQGVLKYCHRFYCTGDRSRWLPDGNIEFLGRIDNQIKIRGFRVEPGEIENQLLQHQQVKDAVVIARERTQEDTYLCAYVVLDTPLSNSAKTFDVSELKAYLSEVLPLYMVPSYFVPLSEIPLTPRGKLNKRVLPEVKIDSEGHLAPRNERESILHQILADVLHIDREKLDIDSNFFQLGSHSLHLIRIHSKLKTTMNRDFEMVKMFEFPTIRLLAQYLDQSEPPPSDGQSTRDNELEKGKKARLQRLQRHKKR